MARPLPSDYLGEHIRDITGLPMDGPEVQMAFQVHKRVKKVR